MMWFRVESLRLSTNFGYIPHCPEGLWHQEQQHSATDQYLRFSYTVTSSDHYLIFAKSKQKNKDDINNRAKINKLENQTYKKGIYTSFRI